MRRTTTRSFWSTVAAALVRVVGEPFVTALQDVRTADVTELPGRIAAAFTDAGPVLLVLDNLHELRSAAVHEGLLRLVERPTGLSVVVASRRICRGPWTGCGSPGSLRGAFR